MTPRPKTNADLRQLYEHVFASPPGSWFTYPTDDCVEQVCSALNWAGKSVLEIGCGTGETAAALAARGARVLAIDYADSAISEAQRRHGAAADFQVARIEDINDRFDVVVLQEVLEHADDPQATLIAIASRVNERGSVVITCPAFFNPRGYVWMTLQLLFEVPMSLSDLHFIGPSHMSRWASDAGFTLTEWHSFRHWQSWGDGMTHDMRRRLTNALRDAGLPATGIERLLTWMAEAADLETPQRHNGSKILYHLTKNEEHRTADDPNRS